MPRFSPRFLRFFSAIFPWDRLRRPGGSRERVFTTPCYTGTVPVVQYFSWRIFSFRWLLVKCFSRVVVCGVLHCSVWTEQFMPLASEAGVD